jgi:uncharacterized membrane protein
MWIERLFKICLSIKQPIKFSSIVIGVVAAVLWMFSASVDIPLAPGAAIGGTLPSDPFNIAMREAASLNKYAALATAISTSLLMIAEAIEWAAFRTSAMPAAPTAAPPAP